MYVHDLLFPTVLKYTPTTVFLELAKSGDQLKSTPDLWGPFYEGDPIQLYNKAVKYFKLEFNECKPFHFVGLDFHVWFVQNVFS